MKTHNFLHIHETPTQLILTHLYDLYDWFKLSSLHYAQKKKKKCRWSVKIQSSQLSLIQLLLHNFPLINTLTQA